MHESLIDNLKIHIDDYEGGENLQTGEKNYKLVGWCGSEELDVGDIRLHTTQSHGEQIVISDSLTKLPRQDVADWYDTDKFLNTGFEITFEPTESMGDITMQAFLQDEWVDVLKVESSNEVVTAEIVEDSLDLFEFEIRKNASPEFLVVDNFYADPDSVREFALRQTFEEHKEYHKGVRTEGCFIVDGMREELENLLNKKITDWEMGTNGIFQYCTSEDPLVYHMDTQSYAAAVYLTPNAPPQCGTSFFRSKVNKLTKPPTEQDAENHGKSEAELFDEIFSTGFYDKTNLELIDKVGNVYNRLVIWDATLIHAASEYFGNDKTNSRLFHLFFFDAE